MTFAARHAAAIAMLAAAPMAAQRVAIDTSKVVSVAWLAKHRGDADVRLLYVARNDSGYRAGHIPGAEFVAYGAFAVTAGGLSSELPPIDTLRSTFERFGVSSNSHVILTGTPLEVSRAFFTLDYLGLPRVSVLNGGATAWRSAGGALERTAPPAPARGRIDTHPRPDIVATRSWLAKHLDDSRIAIVDTRTTDEYLGTGGGSTGHIAGARRLDWPDLFATQEEFTLADDSTLARVWHSLAAPGDTVVPYCRVGHRSSATWLVARLLGFPAKLYDGSYEDWSSAKIPLIKGSAPGS